PGSGDRPRRCGSRGGLGRRRAPGRPRGHPRGLIRYIFGAGEQESWPAPRIKVSADAQEGRLVTIMSGAWKRLALTISAAALTALVPAVQAHAVSDGDYNNKKQGCTGN